MGCKPQQRHVLAIMLFFSLVVSLSQRYNLSIAITQMVNVPNANVDSKTSVDVTVCPIETPRNFIEAPMGMTSNATYESLPNHNGAESGRQTVREKFKWSQQLQGIILSSYYWGYILLQLPGGVLAQKFGGKYILCGGIFLSAILSLITPWAIDVAGAYGLIVVRVLMGLCLGPLYPCISAFLVAWVPIGERGRLCSIIYMGSSMGGVFSTYVSGLLLSHFDHWNIVFYFFGTLAMIWCALFTILCSSEPHSHPFINAKERKYLADALDTNRRCEDDTSRPATPWKAIATSAPVLALIWVASAYDWSLYVITTDLPKYMNDVIHVPIHRNGIYSAMPRVLSLIVSLSAGCICDWMTATRAISVTNVRRTFIGFASVTPAIFVLAATYAECNEVLVVTLLMISIGSQGLMTCGIVLNPMDLSPMFASTLSGLMNCISTFTGILAPYVVGALTPNALLTEWRTVFCITSALHVSQAIIFFAWGSGRVQPWNAVGANKDREETIALDTVE